MLDKNDEKTIKDAMDHMDQRILVEYGLVPFGQYYQGESSEIYQAAEKTNFHPEELPIHIRILMMLDKQDMQTLKLIHTYLELQLGIEPDLSKFAKKA